MTTLNELQQQVGQLCTDLNTLHVKLNSCQLRLVEEIADKWGYTMLSKEEHIKLVEKSSKSSEEYKEELRTELEKEVKLLNTELQHQVDSIRLKQHTEMEVLRARLQYCTDPQKSQFDAPPTSTVEPAAALEKTTILAE